MNWEGAKMEDRKLEKDWHVDESKKSQYSNSEMSYYASLPSATPRVDLPELVLTDSRKTLSDSLLFEFKLPDS